eukprot:Mrub_00454.p1 GENE.Mrub_00454~~Mrub_00454.p1  ORF type:complete len:1053 (+),score=177.66 Mrub_00454:127-3159(+)
MQEKSLNLLHNTDKINQFNSNLKSNVEEQKKQNLINLYKSYNSFKQANDKYDNKFINFRTSNKEGENHFNFYRKDNKTELLRNKNNEWVLLYLDGLPPLKYNENVIDKDLFSVQKYSTAKHKDIIDDFYQNKIKDHSIIDNIYRYDFDPLIYSSMNPKIRSMLNEYSKLYPGFESVPKENDRDLKTQLLEYSKIYKNNLEIMRFAQSRDKLSSNSKLNTQTHSWKTTFKDYWDEVKNKPLDLRSDEESNSDKYYTGHREIPDMYQYKFYVKDGDDSLIKENRYQLITSGDDPQESVDGSKQKWMELSADLKKKIDKDSLALKDHLDPLQHVESMYDALVVVGVSSLRLANKLVNMFERNIRMTEEKTQILFRYSSMSYLVDLVNDSPMVLPYYWKVLNPKYSSEEKSMWKQTETAKIKLTTNPVSSRTKEPGMDYGNMIFTKYHKTYDGSLHFSMKVPSDAANNRSPLFGTFVRYGDQFNHYRIKFDVKKQMMTFSVSTFKDFKVIIRQEVDCLKLDSWIRVAIEFKQYVFRIWVSVDDDSYDGKLDEDKRKKELAVKDRGMPYLVYDPTLKEGKIGFFSSDSLGFEIKNITFYSDECFVPPEIDEKFKFLLSPQTFRYIELYKGSASFWFNIYTSEDTKPDGEFKFGEGVGKFTKVLLNTEASINPKILKQGLPAVWAHYKDKSKVCVDNCVATTGFYIKNLENSGNLALGIKYIDENNYYAIIIGYNDEKDETNLSVVMIDKSKQTNFFKKKIIIESEKWYKLTVKILVDEFIIYLDNNLILSNLKILNLNKTSGTYAFGINGLQVMFGGFYTGVIESVTNSKTKLADPNFDDVSNLAALDELANSNFGMQVCENKKTAAQRKEFCLSLSEDGLQKCVDKFCEMCCYVYDKGQQAMKCKNECNANSTQAKVDFEEHFMTCFKTDPKSNEIEMYVKCNQCCADQMNEYIEEGMFKLCQKECNVRFNTTFKYPSVDNDKYGNGVKISDVRNTPSYVGQMLYMELVGEKPG